jgi:hypothetical protein
MLQILEEDKNFLSSLLDLHAYAMIFLYWIHSGGKEMSITSHGILRRFSRLVLLAVMLLWLTACNLPYSTPVIPTPTPAPTNTPLPNTPSPTSTIPLPTPTNTSVEPSATSIVFAPGTTAAVETGTIQPGQVLTFTINAGQYQPMILLLNANNTGAYLAVYEPNGNVLLDPAKKWTNWQWLLPKTELYTIQVIGGSAAGDYTLTVKVAARITFASGASSATVNGSTYEGFVISYTVSAAANQTMTVNLDVPANSAALDIFGLADGNSLVRVSDNATTFTGSLPATEDYIIEIFPIHGQVVNYSLTVTVH